MICNSAWPPIRPCIRIDSSQWLLVLLQYDIPFWKVFGVLDQHVREDFDFGPRLVFLVMGASKGVKII